MCGSKILAMRDWIGRTLGRVRIESLLARGGMAEVFLGTHTTLHRPVAVKILRNPLGEDRRPLERFELEARAVAKLRHPNIVQVYDFDTVEDQPYIVMEYIAGPSLSRYLSVLHADESRLELPIIARLLTGVANALQYAHESGVVHRDVKPGNILLTSRAIQIVPGQTLPLDFEPVLTDFGLVRLLDSNRQTTLGQTAGTPAYMSPEQAMGLATDGRTDIYSLGVVLYEMLSGSVPFDGETTMSVLLKHLNEPPPPIPGIAPALQEVLDHALAKNADDRFQQPSEFSAAFIAALTETADAQTVAKITRVSESARATQPPVPIKGRSYWRPVLGLVALLGLAGAAWLFRGMLPIAPAATPTLLQSSHTPALPAPIALGPTGVLQFHDGNAILDRVTLVAQAMPAPPGGRKYEVWLVDGDERLSLSFLSVDSTGKGSLTFNDSQKRNLLAAYSGVEVVITGSDTNGTERVAYSYSLPNAGLAFLRALLVSSPDTPEEIGLIHGLTRNMELMVQTAEAMVSNYESGDLAGTKKNAEAMMNILVGDRTQGDRDWNGDGQTTDPGDGYGLLLNGDNLGYIQAVYSHADYAVNSPGASRYMIGNGESVQACTENFARWAPELRTQLLTILNAGTLSDMEPAVRRAAALADQMLNGIDLNENGSIEPIVDECGAISANEAAYHMADMPLLPVNPLDTPTALSGTVTPTLTPTPRGLITPTPTRRSDQSPTNPPNVQPTQPSNNGNPPPRDTRPPRPTREPKPTKEH